MDSKERQWHLKKIGKFSASCADDLLSASGKWIQGNISYLLEIQYQRETNEPKPPVSSRQMTLGKENEPYAIEWLRANYPKMDIRHCDADFTDKVFEEPYPDLMFGASPDAFLVKNFDQRSEIVYNEDFKKHIKALIEVKCLVGREETLRYMSSIIPYNTKRERAKKDHGNQMAAQMFAYPEIDLIYLLKYLPQIDDNEFDLRSVLDPSRGVLFEFSRDDLSVDIDIYAKRVRFADEWLRAGKDVEMLVDIKQKL